MIEAKANFSQAFASHGAAQRIAVIGVEQQKAATAGPDQLAADGSVFPANFIPAVDAFVGGPGRSIFFVQPVLVHQFAKAPGVAAAPAPA